MNDPAYIHSHAIVDKDVELGDNTKVWAFAQIMSGAVVGENCSISGGCFIESGAKIGSRVTIKNACLIWDGITIEDDCFIGPNVTFSNDKQPRSPRMPLAKERYSDPKNWRIETRVEKGASIGAGTVIAPGITIGAYAMIGAGSLITKDVPPHALSYGSPAEMKGMVCECGTKILANNPCSKCGYVLAKNAFKF